MEKTIKFLLLPNGERLVSWHRHDYTNTEINGNFYMIDGGQEDYVRYSAEAGDAFLMEETLEEALPWIREMFKWTSRYDKEMNLLETPVKRPLSELDDDHIGKLISQNQSTSYMRIIFQMELDYRKSKNTKYWMK